MICWITSNSLHLTSFIFIIVLQLFCTQRIKASLSAEIHPRMKTADIGKSVTLNCTISGSPIASIEWLHNGQPVVSNSRIRFLSRNILYISSVERRDKGTYQCLVHNDLDSAQAYAQLELGDDAPQFLSTFSEQTLQPGLPLSLKCVASGNPIPSVTWLVYDSIPVPDNPRYRTGDYVTRESLLVSYVNISSTISEDGGLYSCTASNDVSAVRHSARINIYGPPSVRSLTNITAVAGERMSLTCPTGGFPIDNIVWERENVRLPYNHRQKVYPNGTLTVTDVERATDEGKYTCTARQSKDSKSATASVYVQVLVRPVIEPFSFPKSLHQSQRYNLLCTVIKGDQPIQIEWFKDDKKLTDGHLSKTILIKVTDYSLTLAFQSVQPDHRGNYTCVASNAAGSSSHSASMIIHVPPRWRIEPIDTSVVKGRNAVIDCDTDAYPPPIISWSRADGLLGEPPSEFKFITSNSHLRPYKNGSLAIHNAQRSDSGYYMCAATNGIGVGLSKVIKLTVLVAASFDTKFRAETVRKGLEARIRCDAIGDKPITITWLKDKMPFNPRDDPRYELIESITSDGIRSEIVIRNADRRDSALFSCITSNSYGHDDTNIQLITQEPPDAPSNVKIVEYDGRSARISWSAPYSGNSPITHYLVYYKLESDKWSQHSPNVIVSASETSVFVRGLLPVTNYQIRVQAINGLGKSESSEVIILKTIEETPGGPPLHIKALPLSSKSIKVNWKSPRKELHYGVLRGYYVGYKAVNSADGKQLNSDFIYKTLEINNEGFVEECTITELRRSTKYHVIVQAYNSKGAGPSSEPILVKTLEMDPPSSPALRLVSSSANSIQLSWQMNVDDSTPATGFILHFKKESSDWEELRLTDTKSHTHEWLRCGTRYQYYITAFNSVGKSDPSTIVSAKTDGTSPVAPDRNSLLSVNTSTATIYLDAFHDGGCAINKFEVMYKLQKSFKWISLSSPVFIDQKHIVLSDLMPSTSYDLKITAFNQAGSTEAQYSFTTSPIALQDDHAVLLGSKSPTSVPFYADFLVIVPSTISLVVVITLLSLVYVIFTRKPRHGSNVYMNYSPNKLQDNETVDLTNLDQSHAKKLVSSAQQSHDSAMDSALQNLHYPTPYAMTKIESEERVPLNVMSRSSPLKTQFSADHDAIYATVKRTPRPPRSDVHIYQYPSKLNMQPSDSGCESESSNVGAWRTSIVRFEQSHDPSTVKLFSDPQSAVIYGRNNHRRSSHNYQ